MSSERLTNPHALSATVYDPQFKADLLDALDETTAIRRISQSRFVLEAVSYFLGLPGYARDQAMHQNTYDIRMPGRPGKDA